MPRQKDLKRLVRARQRIRANHRLSARGRLSPDQRAAYNLALTEIIHIWQQRRAPRHELPAGD